MKYIIFDTETTGLLQPEVAKLSTQPKCIELAAIKYEDGKEISRYESLFRQNDKLPEIITKITGIYDEDLENQPYFHDQIDEITDFFFGTDVMVAHNIHFDRMILLYELMRMDRMCNFPWPPRHICTIQVSSHMHGHRLNLSELYKISTGKEFKDAHRAMKDVEALTECFHFLLENEYVTLSNKN